MKRTCYALALLLFLTAAMAPSVTAAPQGQQLPPPPEWPIIGPILRWLGLAPESTEVELPAIPDLPPGVSEYTPESIDDLVALWEKMANGETVRVTLQETTLQAMVDRWVEPMPGLSSLSVTFEEGQIRLEGTVATSEMEEYLGFQLPDFLTQDDPTVVLVFTAQAVDCRPQITLETVRINGKGWPVKWMVQEQLTQQIDELWPQAHLCIEAIYITDDALIVEGHREQP